MNLARGGAFVAESLQWLAVEREREAAARRPGGVEVKRNEARAPLGEFALLHMDDTAIGSFLTWRDKLPKGA